MQYLRIITISTLNTANSVITSQTVILTKLTLLWRWIIAKSICTFITRLIVLASEAIGNAWWAAHIIWLLKINTGDIINSKSYWVKSYIAGSAWSNWRSFRFDQCAGKTKLRTVKTKILIHSKTILTWLAWVGAFTKAASIITDKTDVLLIEIILRFTLMTLRWVVSIAYLTITPTVDCLVLRLDERAD